MKFVTFRNKKGEQRAGLLQGGRVIDMQLASGGELPDHMLDFLLYSEKYLPIASRLSEKFQSHIAAEPAKEPLQEVFPLADVSQCAPFGGVPQCAPLDGASQCAPLDGVSQCVPLADVSQCAPLPNPPSVRDFYAFEGHVKTARAKRGLPMVPEWYEIPVFYFSNPRCITGPDEPVRRPNRCKSLDYELEIACIIGKEGRNIRAAEADDYIFGYCIMNDWSARDIQSHEMRVGLGPAKGKDFATSLGPYLVTKDELEPYRTGDRYNLEMTAKVNERFLSRGNFQDIYYTFGQMVERASEDAVLYPGDVIGSGTVGTGCILELGTEVHRWLEPGDVVELEITGLGVLKNKIE